MSALALQQCYVEAVVFTVGCHLQVQVVPTLSHHRCHLSSFLTGGLGESGPGVSGFAEGLQKV